MEKTTSDLVKLFQGNYRIYMRLAWKAKLWGYKAIHYVKDLRQKYNKHSKDKQN
jgi:hypothetical protein